jgi:hypothetical protein
MSADVKQTVQRILHANLIRAKISQVGRADPPSRSCYYAISSVDVEPGHARSDLLEQRRHELEDWLRSVLSNQSACLNQQVIEKGLEN